MAAALGVAFGVFTQVAALALMMVMLGAIQRKLFVWHTGFWGGARVRLRGSPTEPVAQLAPYDREPLQW